MCKLFNRINAFCSIDAFLFLNKKHLAELSPAYVSALLDLVTWLKYQAVQQASVDKSVTQLSMLFLCFKYEGLKVLWILLLQTLYVAIWATLVRLRRMKTGPAAATISVEKKIFLITSKPSKQLYSALTLTLWHELVQKSLGNPDRTLKVS